MRGWLLGIVLAFVAAMAAWLFLSTRPVVEEPGKQQNHVEPAQPEKSKDPFYKELANRIGPTPANAEDLKKVKVQKGSLSSDGVDLPYGFALNILPVLEADKNINARHVQVGVEIQPSGGIHTTLWSQWGVKTKSKLIFDWGKGTLERDKTSEAAGMELDEAPPGEKYPKDPTSIRFGINEKDKKSPCIAIHLPKSDSKTGNRIEIPYEYDGFSQLACFISSSYPIAVLPKVKRVSRALVSILLFDKDRGKLLGEIPLPEEATHDRPYFALDTKQDVLIGAAYYLGWAMYVDLRPYMQKIKSGKE